MNFPLQRIYYWEVQPDRRYLIGIGIEKAWHQNMRNSMFTECYLYCVLLSQNETIHRRDVKCAEGPRQMYPPSPRLCGEPGFILGSEGGDGVLLHLRILGYPSPVLCHAGLNLGVDVPMQGTFGRWSRVLPMSVQAGSRIPRPKRYREGRRCFPTQSPSFLDSQRTLQLMKDAIYRSLHGDLQIAMDATRHFFFSQDPL